jgi:allantoin racemase
MASRRTEGANMSRLRIRSVTPIHVGAEELARRQARYDEFSPDNVRVQLEDLPEHPDIPRQLTSDEQIEASDIAVADVLLDTDPAEFDLVLPDCVLDPGVDRIRAADPSVPCVGLSELAAGFVGGLGLRLAAVARNRPIGDELARRFELYGIGERWVGVEVLGLSFEDISDDARWNEALEQARGRRPDADAILNGCSAVDVTVTDGTPVFDPTRLALRLLGLAADEHLAVQA